MFALENLAYFENLAPPCSSENSSPPSFYQGRVGGGAFYGENGMNPLGMLPIQQNVCTKGPEGKCFYPM